MASASDRIVSAVCRLGLAAGAMSTACIFVLLAGSSVRRYLLGTPIAYAEELTGLLFVVTSFAAAPFGVLANRHIRLLVLWRRLPAALGSWLAVVGDTFAVAILALIVREMVAFAEYSREVGARTEISELLLWPWMYVMPGALALLGLALAWRAFERAKDAIQGRPVSLEADGVGPD